MKDSKFSLRNLYFFNESALNAVDAFGIDLKTHDEFFETFGYDMISDAQQTGEAIGILLGLDRYGRVTPEGWQHLLGKQNEVLLDAGILSSKDRLTDRLNVIVTIHGDVIFYEGKESLFDQTSIIEKIILSATEVKSVEDVMTTSIWQNYAKL